jgi:hypothetical protein
MKTCEDKESGRFGNVLQMDPAYSPVAMTMYEGTFNLQTTDNPNGSVRLDKLPLVFGPLKPIVTK